MDFTGERYVPATVGIEDLYLEHISRYALAAALARGKRVLDVGCGCGYGSHYLALHGASVVLGVDTAEDALRFARERYSHPTLGFALMNAGRLAVDSAFDLVTCFEMIEHVEDAPAVLSQISGVMSKDGILLVSTPNKAVYVAGGRGGTNPFHRREYTLQEFERLLTNEFATVSIIGQYWTEGIALVAREDLKGCDFRAMLVGDDGSGSGRLALGNEPLYFVAACARTTTPKVLEAALEPFAVFAGTVRYAALKRHLHDLEQEFDKRGAWAQSLDKQVHERDQIITSLQAEVGKLRSQAAEDRDLIVSIEARIKEHEAAAGLKPDGNLTFGLAGAAEPGQEPR
jgi:ubiquinone/menaquinone biosynthesis C-methylase UbiE